MLDADHGIESMLQTYEQFKDEIRGKKPYFPKQQRNLFQEEIQSMNWPCLAFRFKVNQPLLLMHTYGTIYHELHQYHLLSGDWDHKSEAIYFPEITHMDENSLAMSQPIYQKRGLEIIITELSQSLIQFQLNWLGKVSISNFTLTSWESSEIGIGMIFISENRYR